jgi:hypothetical protein
LIRTTGRRAPPSAGSAGELRAVRGRETAAGVGVGLGRADVDRIHLIAQGDDLGITHQEKPITRTPVFPWIGHTALRRWTSSTSGSSTSWQLAGCRTVT